MRNPIIVEQIGHNPLLNSQLDLSPKFLGITSVVVERMMPFAI
jgi:hypothetical protein